MHPPFLAGNIFLKFTYRKFNYQVSPPPLFGKDVRNGSEHKDINSENEVIGIRYLQPDPLPPHASGFSLFANLDFDLFLID